MPTLLQLRTRVNSWLSGKWQILVDREEEYYAQHGKYWQGKRSHSITPPHTSAADVDTTPDRFDQHPTDQAETWLDMFPGLDGTSWPVNLEIVSYDGPEGKGWIATLEISVDGVAYSRRKAYGPETYVDYNWRLEEDYGVSSIIVEDVPFLS